MATDRMARVILSLINNSQARYSNTMVTMIRLTEINFEAGLQTTTGRVFLPYAASPSKSSVSLFISRMMVVRNANNANPPAQPKRNFRSGILTA